MTLHNEQEAIKQAIEGGWQAYQLEYKNNEVQIDTERVLIYSHDRLVKDFSYEKILLDPLFWQALGKARGWKEEKCMDESDFPNASDGFKLILKEIIIPVREYDWKYNAIRYFETRLSSGDLKSFWENLP